MTFEYQGYCVNYLLATIQNFHKKVTFRCVQKFLRPIHTVRQHMRQHHLFLTKAMDFIATNGCAHRDTCVNDFYSMVKSFFDAVADAPCEWTFTVTYESVELVGLASSGAKLPAHHVGGGVRPVVGADAAGESIHRHPHRTVE